MTSRGLWFVSAVVVLVPVSSSAAPLRVVDVGSSVNCVFDTGCTVTVSDSVEEIPLPVGGTARLQSRTFVGTSGAPADGYFGYAYRVNLIDAVGTTFIPCVQALRVTFGPVASFQYDGIGPVDQVYSWTSGSGSIGVASADQVGNVITFTFDSPVCAGGSPGGGESSRFFGLASAEPPVAVTAVVVPLDGGTLSVGARAPRHDKCTTGAALPSTTNACVQSICAVDAFCCNTAWDAICVSEVRTVCDSLVCAEANGSCTHSLCSTGPSLVSGCDATKANCVASICAADPFCCSVSWDGVCVGEVASVCGSSCD